MVGGAGRRDEGGRGMDGGGGYKDTEFYSIKSTTKAYESDKQVFKIPHMVDHSTLKKSVDESSSTLPLRCSSALYY